MSTTESSGTPPHPPLPRMETRTCAACEGEGYFPIEYDYDWTTGLLTIVGGLCRFCGGKGERVVFIYGRSGA